MLQNTIPSQSSLGVEHLQKFVRKRVLLVSGNYFPEPTGIGKYNKEMTDWMADNGLDCTVISTYPYYPFWKVQEPYTDKHLWYSKETLATAKGNTITVYRCPHYVPNKPTGKRRIALDFSFSISVFFQIMRLLMRKKFDVVITVVPPMPLGLLSVLYKKMKKAKFVYHIQDLQIEAARDLQLIKSKVAIRTLFRIEKFIIRNADTVSSISKGMIKKIKEKTGDKDVVFFPNWADLKFFYPLKNKAELKREFGFSSDDTIILYSGSIGEKQGLEAILKAANVYKESSVKFLICGSGPYQEKLQQMANEKDLANVVFIPLQPHDKFNKFLNMADAHLIIQKANTSDLVMPSKLTTILAVGGLAVVTANPHSSLYNMISEHQMGILAEAETDDALVKAIFVAIQNDNSCIRQNARRYAEEYLSIDSVMHRYVADL